MEYELLFFTSAASEDKVPAIKQELEEILTSLGGKLTNNWTDIGKRKFAYPIKRETHGFFSYVHFTLEEKDKLPEIGKRINLNNKVMRHIIVRVDEVKAPAPKKAKVAEKAAAPEITTPEKVKAKPVAEKTKAGLDELDDKLSEILDENPE